jgi:hypothetical protein
MTQPPGTTSIQELLRYEEEPLPEERRSRSTAGWAIKSTLYAAALAGVIVLMLRFFGVGLPYPLVFVALLALFALRRLVRLVAAPPPARAAMVRRQPADDDGSYHWAPADGLRSAIGRWETRLEWGHDSVDRFARSIQPRLAEMVDERLRMRHGISRAADPAAARAVLGEPLWTFLTTPVTKPPPPREVAAVLARMEEL